MEVQGERKDEDRSPSYEGGYLYSDICRTWDRIDYIAAFHVFAEKTEEWGRANDAVYSRCQQRAFHQHTIRGKKLQLFLFAHGRKFVLQFHFFIKKAAGIKELFKWKAALRIPFL